jgi:hypothetical protein
MQVQAVQEEMVVTVLGGQVVEVEAEVPGQRVVLEELEQVLMVMALQEQVQLRLAEAGGLAEFVVIVAQVPVVILLRLQTKTLLTQAGRAMGLYTLVPLILLRLTWQKCMWLATEASLPEMWWLSPTYN